MGYGLPAAIGASVAANGSKPVIAVMVTAVSKWIYRKWVLWLNGIFLLNGIVPKPPSWYGTRTSVSSL